jgi:hypothetical protein
MMPPVVLGTFCGNPKLDILVVIFSSILFSSLDNVECLVGCGPDDLLFCRSESGVWYA